MIILVFRKADINWWSKNCILFLSIFFFFSLTLGYKFAYFRSVASRHDLLEAFSSSRPTLTSERSEVKQICLSLRTRAAKTCKITLRSSTYNSLRFSSINSRRSCSSQGIITSIRCRAALWCSNSILSSSITSRFVSTSRLLLGYSVKNALYSSSEAHLYQIYSWGYGLHESGVC